MYYHFYCHDLILFVFVFVVIPNNSCRHLYQRGGLKNGNHELEMAGDAVKQDVLLELILVIHVSDLEQKRNNNNKNKTLKRQKTRTIMTAGGAVIRDVFFKLSLAIFKMIMTTTTIA